MNPESQAIVEGASAPQASATASRPVREEVGRTHASPRPRWWRDQLRRRMLMAADLLTALLIAVATTAAAGESVLPGLVAVPIALLSAKLLGLYDADHRALRHLTVDEVPTLTGWTGITTVATMAIAPGLDLGLTAGLVLAGATLASALLRGSVRYAWRRVTPPERTLIVGSGEPAAAIGRKIELFQDMHLKLERIETPADHLEHRNGDEDAAMARALAGVDRVILAWGDAHPKFIEGLLGHCRRLEVKLSVISPFRGRARPTLRLSQVADLPILEYNTWDVPRSTRLLKRAGDVATAATGIVALAPLFLAIAAAIKLSDRGPVFFRQRRAGEGGRPFSMLKFRSMTVDAEAHLSRLIDLRSLPEPAFKLRPDPRVTPVGRVLRRFSLDELPQLWNVLRGEMSLVGPRPEELAVVECYRPEHGIRLQLRPGMTGPMQVFGRAELSFEERLAVEIDYVENVSIGRDLALIMQTLPAVVRGTGAF